MLCRRVATDEFLAAAAGPIVDREGRMNAARDKQRGVVAAGAVLSGGRTPCGGLADLPG